MLLRRLRVMSRTRLSLKSRDAPKSISPTSDEYVKIKRYQMRLLLPRKKCLATSKSAQHVGREGSSCPKQGQAVSFKGGSGFFQGAIRLLLVRSLGNRGSFFFRELEYRQKPLQPELQVVGIGRESSALSFNRPL